MAEERCYHLVLHTRAGRPALAGYGPSRLAVAVLEGLLPGAAGRLLGHLVLPQRLEWIACLGGAPAEHAAAVKRQISRRLPVATRRRFPPPLWARRAELSPLSGAAALERALDALHYRPVRDGHAAGPGDWPWSSYTRYRAAGRYPADWGCSGVPAGLEGDR